MTKKIRLTEHALSGGCAAKVGPGDLRELLSVLESRASDDVLIDMRDADDAGAVRLDGRRALVHTVDVITPIVDDPETFGRIAAANAVSDIYAMGADPISSVAILGVPKALPRSALAPIMRGAGELLARAGAHLVGGHTLKAAELLLGFAVTGTVESKHLITNRGAKPKQVVLLTKALGTGVLYQAMRQGVRTAKQTRAAVASMTALSRGAKEAMLESRVRCATDVTGFGLAGHALNIARASGVDVVLTASALPMLDGVREHLAAGVFPEAVEVNRKGYGRQFVANKGVAESFVHLACDPQTSGGILMVVDRGLVEAVARAVEVHEIGEIRSMRGEAAAVRLEP